MPQKCPSLVAWPISGNPSHHKEFLQKLQSSSFPPGDPRPSPATTQHLLNGCEQRNRDPTSGPIEDIVNFLSESFSKGFQYCSLNSYRSAISAVHSKIDGYSVGKHPLISRLLRAAFNERPPLPRYSSFWNVDVVLSHLRGLGDNGSSEDPYT